MQDRTSPTLIFWFFLSLFVISCLLLGWLLSPFISIIVIGSVVTGIFSPIYRYLNRRLKPTQASLLTCIAIFIVLFIPIVVCIGILANEAHDLYQTAKTAVLDDKIRGFIESSRIYERAGLLADKLDIKLDAEEIFKEIPKLGSKAGLYLFEQARSITNNALMFLANFFFMLLIAYFLLMDGGKLITFIVELSPLPNEQDEKLIEKFKNMAGAVIIGNGLCGIIQGVIGGILFQIFGISSAFLWGVLMSLLAFLPIVGIGLVFVPTAIILLLEGKIASGIFFLLFYVCLSVGMEYLFKPRLVGKRVQMHTLLVFLSIMGGLKLFGILGIIYGPLIVTAFLTLTDIYRSSYRTIVEPRQLLPDRSCETDMKTLNHNGQVKA